MKKKYSKRALKRLSLVLITCLLFTISVPSFAFAEEVEENDTITASTEAEVEDINQDEDSEETEEVTETDMAESNSEDPALTEDETAKEGEKEPAAAAEEQTKQETPEPKKNAASPKISPLSFLGGSGEDTAQTAKVKVWDLKDASSEIREAYDKLYRVYASGVSSNRAWDYPGNTIDHILDNKENTFWEPYGGNEENFHLQLTFTFDQPETIGRLVYGARLDAGNKGFPYEFAIYSSDTASGDNFKMVAKGSYSAATGNLLEITFKEAEFKRLKFEFVTAKEDYPSCREMYFYREDLSSEQLDNMFTDYAHFKLADFCNTREKLDLLVEELSENPKYESAYKASIQRAYDILDEKIKYEPDKFELSTAEDAKNKINRTGDVTSYGRGSYSGGLRFTSSSTNRQATGIAAYAGDKITVYVEAEDGDPLPKIRFSQSYGHWTSWLSEEKELARGVNTFTVQDFWNSNYSHPCAHGGAIYIVNPYVPEEFDAPNQKTQSDKVKVYIEGGDRYPIYHLGDDEKEYIAELNDYAARVKADPMGISDMTELVSDHVIMTVTATRASEIYDYASPARNLETWNEIIKESLIFEGVTFDRKNKHYYYMNEFLNVNYRVSQFWPNGYMFAAGEHIGLYEKGDGEDTLIYCLNERGKPAVGWGHIHEYGHTIDLQSRVIAETTNNMVANFLNTYFNGQVRNEGYIREGNNMTSERTYVNTDKYGTAFNNNRSNYMIYFLVESFRPGWWGDSNNIYRYNEEWDYDFNSMNQTERHIFISSLALGVDLGYYFERWGYQLNQSTDPVFSRSKASDAYKKAVEKALTNNDIVTNELPIWYMDGAQYMFMRNENDPNLYTEKDTVNIVRVLKGGNGYTLTLPVATDDAHLGYEIWEGNEIIGFTHTSSFTDTTSYASDYEPQYSIVAYDRALSHTAKSDPVSVSEVQEGVAEYDGRVYNTIADAVAAAASGGTVYVLKDSVENGVTVNKAITIATKNGEDRVIKRAGDTPVFSVVQGGKLTMDCSGENGLITIDGERYARTCGLIEVSGNGQLNLNSVVIQGGITSGYGGGIKFASAGSSGTLIGVKFINNSAGDGGGLWNCGNIKLNNCIITENTCTRRGGGISNDNGGIMVLTGCTFTKNNGLYGGGLCMNGNTTISGGRMEENTATYGGAFYTLSEYAARAMVMKDGLLAENNDAEFGGFFYMNSAPALTTITNIVVGNNIGPMAEASGKTEGGAACDIYIAQGNVEIDGRQIQFSEGSVSIYKKTGQIKMKNAMPSADFLFTLGSYSTADPVMVTDFALSDISNVIVIKDDKGNTYDTAKGSNGQNVYLSSSSSVTLHENGGTIQSGNLTSYIEGVRTVLPTNIIKEGQTFIGWYKDDAFTEGPFLSIGAEETGNKEYWAKWSQTRYTINYRYDGGTMSGDYPTSFTADDEIMLPGSDVVKRSGTTFEGWYENSNFTGEKVTKIPVGTIGNKTYYANWVCVGKDPVREHETAASCSQEGQYDEVVYCMYCNKELSRETHTIPKTDHQFGEWTEYPGGVSKRTCGACGFEDTVIDESVAHVWDTEYTVDKAPTCETDGSESIHCSHCEATDKQRVIPKLGHSPSEPFMVNEVKATCETDGGYDLVVICKTCGNTLSSQHVDTFKTGHTYGEWETIVSATCEGEGSQRRVCTSCGFIDTKNLDKEGHDWNDIPTIDVQPTCTSDGSQSIHCRKCDAKTDSKPLPALDHTPGDPVVEFETPATCETDGSRVVVTYCTVCMTQLSRETQEVKASGHKYTPWQAISTSSCEAGAEQRSCTVCGIIETRNLDESKHEWDINFTTDKEPTCTEGGARSIHCVNCGATRMPEMLPAKGHTEGPAVMENYNPASCITDGSYFDTVYCEVCGSVISRTPVKLPAKGHDYTPWEEIDMPHCEDEGTMQRTCKTCGLIETKNLEATGHLWSDMYTVDVQPTCTTDGSQSIHCLNCGAVRDSIALPATGHVAGESVKTVIQKPTCTKEGIYDEEVYCKDCGTLMFRAVGTTKPAGHVYGQPQSYHSCVGVERTKLVCEVCGYTAAEFGQNEAHRWANEYTVDKEATCERDGSQSIHCVNDGCEAVIDSEVIPATGHNFVLSGASDATCTEDGYTGDMICENCGEVLREGTMIPKTGHSFVDGECSVCGEKDPDYKADEEGNKGEDTDPDNPGTPGGDKPGGNTDGPGNSDGPGTGDKPQGGDDPAGNGPSKDKDPSDPVDPGKDKPDKDKGTDDSPKDTENDHDDKASGDNHKSPAAKKDKDEEKDVVAANDGNPPTGDTLPSIYGFIMAILMAISAMAAMQRKTK